MKPQLRRHLLKLAALLSVAFGISTSQAEEKELVFGLLPSESIVSKMKHYSPLRDYLSKRLGYHVVLESARDFPEFVQRTAERRYDLLETAPHYVTQALEGGLYQVMTTVNEPMTAKILVLKGGAIRSLDDLVGRVVATPSEHAVITQLGIQYLEQQGYAGERAPIFRIYPTHNAAFLAVLGKQAAAAIVSNNIYAKALHDNQPLVAVASSNSIPNMAQLIARDLDESLKEKMTQAMLDLDKTAEGKAVLKQIAYPGYRRAEAAEFAPLRSYSKVPSRTIRNPEAP